PQLPPPRAVSVYTAVRAPSLWPAGARRSRAMKRWTAWQSVGLTTGSPCCGSTGAGSIGIGGMGGRRSRRTYALSPIRPRYVRGWLSHHDRDPLHKPMQAPFDAIVELTDAFCRAHLDEEYAQLARQATTALCRKRPSPLATGHLKTWACGIVYALGAANFLDRKSTRLNSSHVKISYAVFCLKKK